MRSPHTIGVDPDQARSGSFHAMLSVVVHLTGRFVSVLMPFSDGPRHCGQFSAYASRLLTRTQAATARDRMSIFPFYFFVFVLRFSFFFFRFSCLASQPIWQNQLV